MKRSRLFPPEKPTSEDAEKGPSHVLDAGSETRPEYDGKSRQGNGRSECDQQVSLDLGKNVISRYGCYTCHEIKGFETTPSIAPELSEGGGKLNPSTNSISA